MQFSVSGLVTVSMCRNTVHLQCKGTSSDTVPQPRRPEYQVQLTLLQGRGQNGVGRGRGGY